MSTPWKALSAKTRNTALIISLTIFLAGCFLGWHFIVKPSFLKMALLKNEKSTDVEKNDVLMNISILEKKLKPYAALLSEKKESSWLIQTVSKTAEVSNLALISVVPPASENHGEYDKILVAVEAAGTYHELGDFASRIESAPRFIKITHVRMESVPNDQGRKGVLRILLSLSAFYPRGDLLS